MTGRRPRFVIGITGASGAIYGVRLTQALAPTAGELHVIVSDAGRQVLRHEMQIDLDTSPDPVAALAGSEYPSVRLVDPRDFFSPPASGSFRHDGMAITPCSMATAGRIAHCSGDDLMCRAADVTLKERRTLVLAVRETPLNALHLHNLALLADAGAVVLPACPAFYHHPQSVDDLVCHVVARIAQHLGVELGTFPEWQREGEGT